MEGNEVGEEGRERERCHIERVLMNEPSQVRERGFMECLSKGLLKVNL